MNVQAEVIGWRRFRRNALWADVITTIVSGTVTFVNLEFKQWDPIYLYSLALFFTSLIINHFGMLGYLVDYKKERIKTKYLLGFFTLPMFIYLLCGIIDIVTDIHMTNDTRIKIIGGVLLAILVVYSVCLKFFISRHGEKR